MFMQKLQHAVALHQQGMLNEASDAYQRLLKDNPRDVNVLNFLGVLCFQQARHQEGIKYLKKCLQIKPDFAQAHNNLGNGLRDAGMLKDAAQSLRRAVALDPGYAEAHHGLADVCGKLKDYESALRHASRATELAPRFLPAWVNNAVVLYALGRFQEAVAACDKALDIAPNYPLAHLNKGRSLAALNRMQEAIGSYRLAVENSPTDKDARLELGSILVDAERPEAAEAHLLKVLEIDPKMVSAMLTLGLCYRKLDAFEDAEKYYRQAIEEAPLNAEAYGFLGALLVKLQRFNEAEKILRKAIELRPGLVSAHLTLVEVLSGMLRVDEALVCCETMLAYAPLDEDVLTCALFTSAYASRDSQELAFERAKKYGQIVSARVKERFARWSVERKPHRLKVGLVSGDFKRHPVGFFLEGILAHLDPNKIELIAYQTQRMADDLTKRIVPYFAAWRPISDHSDSEAAKLIHSDGVHLLIDLSGHTGGSRLPMFAYKPAPVQVSWLGYFATTGLEDMDYLMADIVGVPEAEKRFFTEEVWYLPNTRLCLTPPQFAPQVSSAPAIKNGFFTFGSFQSTAKIGDAVLHAWGRILARLPSSRLRLQGPAWADAGVVEQVKERMVCFGFDVSRVAFYGPVSRDRYMAAHSEVDAILDTFPYPGGTTTSEALWMGVPTLTLAGGNMIGRQGASLLCAAGLPDWVASTVDEYVDKAVAIASDVPKLDQLRRGLRTVVAESPLFDGRLFARNLEVALFGMWERYEANHED